MPAQGPQNTRKRQLRPRKPRTGGGPQGNGRITAPKPQKVKAPSTRQVSQARAQAKTYKSQGVAVEKTANQGRRVQRRKRAIEKIHGDHPQTAQQRAANQKPVAKAIKAAPLIALHEAYRTHDTKAIQRIADESSAGSVAAVGRVLDQTTRPLDALASAAKVDVKRIKRNGPSELLSVKPHAASIKAAKRGLIKHDTHTTFSDVLKEGGVKNKALAGVAGFALDVGLDPTTYATFGTGTLEEKAAVKAGEAARKKALGKGLTEEQAQRFSERASKQSAKTARKGKGATVKFAGKEVPGVTRATAHATRPVRAAGRKVVSENARGRLRAVAADVNPNVTPAGVDKAVSQAEIRATRAARAKRTTGERKAVNVAHGIRQHIGEQNYNTVVDAIEAGKIKDLPDALRPHAIALRSQFKHIRKVQRRAGVKVADVTQTKGGRIKGYVYRQLTPEAVAADEKKAHRGGGTKPASSKARKEKRPLADVRVESPDRYREDLHALTAERIAHGTASAAKADLHRALGDLGRTVKRGVVPVVKDGEAIFHIKGAEITEITDKKVIDSLSRPLHLSKDGSNLKGAKRAGGKERQGGRYVVLNKKVVERAQEGGDPQLSSFKHDPGIVHAYDKATSGFKRVALATPGFHIRNLAGDTTQAYIGQPAYRLPGNFRHAGKTLKALGREQNAERALKPVSNGKKVLTHPKYGDLSYEDIAHNLVKAGAARSGYTASELRELSTSGGVKAGGKIRKALRGARQATGATRAGAATKRAFLNREDLPRLASAIHELRRGGTWEQAAQKVADTHFDYAHLTSFERNVARRLFPFYTWSARNIPFQARNVIAKPGKYANFQKVREEAGKAAGVNDPQSKQTRDMYAQLEKAGVKLPGGWQKYLSEWEQRNAGVPVSIKGQKFTESIGLPLQDLNEFPGAAGWKQAREYYEKGMSLTNPIPKDMIEYMENHSFFFRDQIERDYSPLVAAPSVVSAMPAPVRKKLGITDQYIDKKTGKKGWGWPGKLDYLAKTIPGIPNYAQQLATSGADRRGKGPVGKALAFAGLKSVPIDPSKNAVNLAYQRIHEIGIEKAKLSQQGIGARPPKHMTPAYRKLLDQEKIAKQIAYGGKAAQGYKILPTQGGPPKIRVRSSTSTSSGTGGGFFKTHERPSTTSGTPGRGFFK